MLGSGDLLNITFQEYSAIVCNQIFITVSQKKQIFITEFPTILLKNFLTTLVFNFHTDMHFGKLRLFFYTSKRLGLNRQISILITTSLNLEINLENTKNVIRIVVEYIFIAYLC